MAPSRRRLLAAVGAALVAGCNGSNQPAETPERTVTPVDIPRSPEAALGEAVGIETPEVPAAAVVSDDHRGTVTAAAERLVDAAEREAEAADIEPSAAEGVRDGEEPFAVARERLEELRMSSPPRQYRRVDREFGDVGSVLGYARATTGDLDVAAVRAALAAQRERHADLRDGFDHRLAAPVARSLPTTGAAEDALGRAGTQLDAAARTLESLSSPAEPSAVGGAWGRLGQARLAVTNAAGFLGTATDADAPPRRDAIEAAIETEREAVAALDSPRSLTAGRAAAPEPITAVLSTIRSRRSELLSTDAAELAAERPVGGLFGAARIRLEVEAFDAAAAATTDRLGEEGVAAERLVAEKRAAADRLERLGEAMPLQRRLGGFAVDIVGYGDRQNSGERSDPAVTAYFLYVAGRVFADRAFARGTSMADGLAPEGI